MTSSSFIQIGNDIYGSTNDKVGGTTAISSDGSLIAAVNDLNYSNSLNIYSKNNGNLSG